VQVLTGTLPFGKQTGSEVVFKVLVGTRPQKPANALGLGLSDKVWKLLEDCWQADRKLRPSVKDVQGRVKSAASACGILSSVGDIAQRHEDPDSDFTKFGAPLSWFSSDIEFIKFCRSIIPRSYIR
jgi:hypothetical protein